MAHHFAQTELLDVGNSTAPAVPEIRRRVAERDGGAVVQLDMTATPRYGKGGQLFTWTVFDYPVKQAIVDGIVKRPLKGIAKGATDVQSDVASTKYQVYLAAGVERWKEYRDQLAPLGKKPVLFVRMNDTADADDVGDFLRTKKVRTFLEERAFGRRVALEGPEMIAAISSNVARFVTVDLFAKALRQVVVQEQTPRVVSAKRVSETPAFPYSKATIPATKTVFNVVAPDNEFEKRFARFLEDAPDVERFAKLPSQFGFAIEYTDSAASLRYYEPDFVAVLGDGAHRLVETKGREAPDVAHKDRAARLWCEDATALTGTDWQYVKVPQVAFEKLEPERFDELAVFLYEWAR